MASIAFSFGHRHGGKGYKNDGYRNSACKSIMLYSKDLGLSEDQIAKIQKVETEHQKAMIDLKAEKDKIKLEKRDAMKESEYDAAKKLNAKLTDVNEKIMNSKVDLKNEVEKVLTKEQLEKVKELRNERRLNRSDRGFNGCRMMGPGQGNGMGNGQRMADPGLQGK